MSKGMSVKDCVYEFMYIPVCACPHIFGGKGEKRREKEDRERKREVIFSTTLKNECSGSLFIMRQETHFSLLMNFNCNYQALVNHI